MCKGALLLINSWTITYTIIPTSEYVYEVVCMCFVCLCMCLCMYSICVCMCACVY